MSRLDTSLELENDHVDDDWSLNRAFQQLDQTRRRIAIENGRATGSLELRTASPHLTLAANVASRLQGTVLAPEDRETLVEQGRRMGIRDFDAHLVMAVVQDRARRGESLDDLVGPLAMFAHPRRAWLTRHLRLTVGAVGLGLAIGSAVLFIQWLTAAS